MHGQKMRTLESGKITVFNRAFDVYGYSDDTWYQDVKSKGVWQEFRLANLAYFVGPNDICLDLGANVGMMTLALAMLAPKGHVYAFEGSPETTAALQQTIKGNGLTNVDAFNYVMGRGAEKVKFFDMPDVRSSGHYVPASNDRQTTSLWQDTSQVLQYETKSIDGLVEELNIPRVDFIKIDVEGAELDVLAGAKKTLEKFHPIVVMEFNSYALMHLREIPPRRALKEIFEIFEEVYYFKSRTEALVRLENTERSRERFLHDNLFGGFADDLLCTFKGAELVKLGLAAQNTEDNLRAEIAKRDIEVMNLKGGIADLSRVVGELEENLMQCRALSSATERMLRDQLNSIHQSRSWRITAPLRALKGG